MNETSLPNGSGAAAILSATIGCFVLAILTLLGDKSPAIKNSLVLYKPTGALSGVSTGAIVVWLLTWAILDWRWKNRTVAASPIVTAAFVLFALSVLLTFPPILDLF